MADFLRVIIDAIAYLWPFRIVYQWEAGGFYVLGKLWRRIGPGLYPIVPWFMRVIAISAVPGILSTGRRDITLADGKTLTFEASATVRVIDFDLALNSVEHYTETMQELMTAVLAEKLAEVDPVRLTPEKRNRLIADLRNWIGREAAAFGIEVTKLRFITFVQNARTHRLMLDTTAEPW